MLKRITISGDEPVSVQEAKAAARVDGDELDGLIADCISAAREQAEHLAQTTYCGGTLRWLGESWPAGVLPATGATAAEVRWWNGSAMELLDPSAYVCTDATHCRGTALAPALGRSWPDLAPIAAGPRVQIDLQVSRPPSSVPSCVKLYIKAQVAAWLKNPEALTGASMVVNPLYEGLLTSELYR